MALMLPRPALIYIWGHREGRQAQSQPNKAPLLSMPLSLCLY